ncbi:MAG TPA: aminodeoxychorismate/anthranilate synthase component II, partial [Alphaproteobacteria bacterium]|nr:aminodeoxychorismate/anthranilate synthase component II [Alphaproteobacteria bacterium]
MFLVIDNYDSFVHNLARYFEIAGVKTKIVRNDAITLKEIKALKPEALILSPGPCTPKEAGICIEAVKTLGPTLPILGVCLGHQAIGEAYGALTLR